MRGKKNNNPFLFKQFEVQHHLCAHKVGFDGVLLGAWANTDKAKTILDLGCGSGLIALMMAQQNSVANIFGIEIDNASFLQAKTNFENSQWNSRIKAIENDFQKHKFEIAFDHIISNPPYFIDALKTPEERRTGARHFSIVEFDQLIKKAVSSLNSSGKISLIIPSQNKNQILSILNKNDLYISRKCNVFTKSNQVSERILIEATKEKCDVEENDLFVYDSEGNYSAEYIKLTNQFYLNF